MVDLDDSPIIIIGMGSSGSRLLVEVLEYCGIFMGGMFAANPAKEPWIFYPFHEFVDDFRYQETLPADWESIVEARAGELSVFLREELPALYSAAGYAGGAWGIKDPRNTFVVPLYLREFPNCRLLHLVRDGRDVTLSKVMSLGAEHLQLDNTEKLGRCFRVWQNHVQVASSYRTRIPPERFFEIRYEDMCLCKDSALEVITKLFEDSAPQVMSMIGGLKDLYVRSILRLVAHQNRVGKWRAGQDEWAFARDSVELLSYGYHV